MNFRPLSNNLIKIMLSIEPQNIESSLKSLHDCKATAQFFLIDISMHARMRSYESNLKSPENALTENIYGSAKNLSKTHSVKAAINSSNFELETSFIAYVTKIVQSFLLIFYDRCPIHNYKT